MVWRKLRGDVCDAVDGAVVVVAVVVLVSVMVLMLACHPWACPLAPRLNFIQCAPTQTSGRAKVYDMSLEVFRDIVMTQEVPGVLCLFVCFCVVGCPSRPCLFLCVVG